MAKQLVIMLTSVLIAGWATTALAEPPEDKKITICHKAGPKEAQGDDVHKWIEITISKSALQKHIENHGDFVPAEGQGCYCAPGEEGCEPGTF